MTLPQNGPIVIAGGSGFLGRPLADRLAAAGHDVVLLSRRDAPPQGRIRTVAWAPDGTAGPWASALEGAAAVVNLAGESIAGKRWNDEHKARVLESRVQATRSLAQAIAAAAAPPAALVSASGVGFYGPCGDEPVTELTGPGKDFLASVCVKWESEARRAQSDITRVVLLRTGLVLARDGGALPPMLPPFWCGVGGPVGSGRQYWPWIHRHDWLSMVQFAIDTPAVQGPLNVTAPSPVPNRDFARALGRAMHRPALFPVPGFVLKAVVGELAEGILTGQRALPAAATRAGFTFTFGDLDTALQDLFATPNPRGRTKAP